MRTFASLRGISQRGGRLCDPTHNWCFSTPHHFGKETRAFAGWEEGAEGSNEAGGSWIAWGEWTGWILERSAFSSLFSEVNPILSARYRRSSRFTRIPRPNARSLGSPPRTTVRDIRRPSPPHRLFNATQTPILPLHNHNRTRHTPPSSPPHRTIGCLFASGVVLKNTSCYCARPTAPAHHAARVDEPLETPGRASATVRHTHACELSCPTCTSSPPSCPPTRRASRAHPGARGAPPSGSRATRASSGPCSARACPPHRRCARRCPR